MEQKELRELEAKCTQEHPPGCTAACPVHVDIRAMVAALRQGDYAAGFAVLQKNLPFPGIISRICDQPCQQACKRGEVGGAISIKALERVCVENNTKPAAKLTLLPAKNKKIAVVGAGLSGLTTAFDLLKKGYQVVLFEVKDRLGGSLWEIPEDRLPREVLKKDLAVFEDLALEVHYNTMLGQESSVNLSLESLCEDFAAIYLDLGCVEAALLNLGLKLNREGRIETAPGTLVTSNPKVFAGGSQYLGVGNISPITSISHGRMAAISIDRFLQNASLTANRDHEGPFTTKLYTSIQDITPLPPVPMTNPQLGYTPEEASEEANRCLLCQCLECVKACEYLAHYRAYPKRYVREVYNNLSIVMGIHHANTMINSCSLCGLCQEICPGSLDMGEVCHAARKMMVGKGKMPPSAHDFALRDMQFSNSQDFALVRHQPGFSSSRALFFPGCQLSGSAPGQVEKVYTYLQEKLADGVGLMLGCCGAPADWAGQEEMFQEVLGNIEVQWQQLGKPEIIVGCPTCYQVFKDNLPDIPLEFLWSLLDRLGLPTVEATINPSTLAVHDTCTARHEKEIQDSVRSVLRKLGHQIEELAYSRELTECCGFGGLMQFANREIASKAVHKRINESQIDYLAYCAMCRDNFARQGKRTYHLLDLIYGFPPGDPAERPAPGYSERQENRARLKKKLVQEVWGEKMVEEEEDFPLIIADQVQEMLEDRLILVADVQKVVAYAERTGNKLQDAETGYFIAYYKPVSVTYWVEYSPQKNGFAIHKVYSHRLEITD